MNRRKMVDGLSWGACLAILLAMLLGLDRYQRPSLDGGYGPERRGYFSGTLEGADVFTMEIEYGINGVELGRFVAPAEGGVLNFRIEPALLHRGDNIVYLYRVTRRSDAGPWLSLGWMNVRVAGSES